MIYLLRHLNLSQMVTLTVVTAGDALERAKLLHRYIDVAQLLQSIKYGNLFSFVAVMQGLAAPQVCKTTPTTRSLNVHIGAALEKEPTAVHCKLVGTVTGANDTPLVTATPHL